MAQSGKAPKVFGWVNGRGVPVWAITITNAVGAISMMNVSTGSAKAYGYIVNLSGVSTFIVWACISFIHIRFRRGWIAQGRSLAELPFKALAYPFVAYFGVFANIFLALVQGWTNFVPFNAGNFVSAYILLPLFFVIYGIGKLWWRGQDSTRRSWNMDLDSGRRVDLDGKGATPAEGGYGKASVPLWRKIWDSI
jgi:yeast amino acid transporter